LLVVFDILIELVSIIREESPDKAAHIRACYDQEKEADIEDKLDRKILGNLECDSEIHQQERNSYDEEEVYRKI